MNREMLEIARSIKHPFSLAYAHHHTSWLYQHLRLPVETLAQSQKQIRTSSEHGFPLFQATGIIYGAAGRLLQGQAKPALPVLIKGLEAYRATGAGLALPYYLGLLGDACTQAAIRIDAGRALDEALSIADKTEERCNEAEIYRLKGDLAIERGQEPRVAESAYLRSIDIANRQQSKAWELRTTTSLARLYQRTNRRSEARERLGGVLASFTEGFETADFRDAKTVFGQLEPA